MWISLEDREGGGACSGCSGGGIGVTGRRRMHGDWGQVRREAGRERKEKRRGRSRAERAMNAVTRDEMRRRYKRWKRRVGMRLTPRLERLSVIEI